MEYHDPLGDGELLVPTDDGAEIAVSIFGDDHPALILIPGLGSDRHIYGPLLERLPRSLSCAVFDPRGIGASRVGTAPMTMARLAADVAAVAMGVSPDPVAVFGASMGGMVAQQVVLDHPTMIDRGIFAATTAGGKEKLSPSIEAASALMGMGAKTPEEGFRMACRVLYSATFQDNHMDFIELEIRYRQMHPVSARVFLDQRGATLHHVTTHRLHEISTRTLVLHGRADAIQPWENGARLAEGIRGSTLMMHDTAGHLFFHEDPEWAARQIIEFMSQ